MIMIDRTLKVDEVRHKLKVQATKHVAPRKKKKKKKSPQSRGYSLEPRLARLVKVEQSDHRLWNMLASG